MLKAGLHACSEILVVHIVHPADAAVLYILWLACHCGCSQPASLVCGVHYLLCTVESVQWRPRHPSPDAGKPTLPVYLVEPIQPGRKDLRRLQAAQNMEPCIGSTTPVLPDLVSCGV